MKKLRYRRTAFLIMVWPVFVLLFQNCGGIGGAANQFTSNLASEGNPPAADIPPDESPANSGYGFSTTPSTPPSSDVTYIEKNIKTDFGAVCDGAANDDPAFMAFNTWAKAQTGAVQLNIPSGSVCLFKGAARWWTKDIKKLLVVGYGATFLSSSTSGPGFFLGGRGQYQDNLHSARLATVAAGSQTVQLTDKAKLSLFTVGQYALITGFDLQGLWKSPYGYPSNPHYFEFKKVTAIDAANGIISFESPLKNTYKSTWPNYNSGNQFEVDNGGPGTLYALDPSWDTEVEYRGLTISQDNFQTYANGRSVVYRDVKFTGKHCGVPTQSLSWSAINSDMRSCIMEVDKLITTITMENVSIYEIDFQSSSIDLLKMKNSHVTYRLTGTPKKAEIVSSRIANFWPGAYAYGRSDETICKDCDIGKLTPAGFVEGGLEVKHTMANGVITAPNTVGSLRWAVPGTNLIFVGSNDIFQVTDVTQDATNTYVQTTLSGGFPKATGVSLRTHPSPRFTCVRCTGDQYAVLLSDPIAQGRPLYSYYKGTYTAATGTTAQSPFTVWGDLVSLKIDVANPFTGAGNLSFRLSQFDNWVAKKSDGSNFTLAPLVNMKFAGLRTMTPSAATGMQTGDMGWAAADISFSGSSYSGPVFTSTSAASLCPGPQCPAVTVELFTNQGVVPSGE